MNTRHLSGILFFLFISISSWGQSNLNPAIKARFDAYIKYFNEQQWAKVFDMSYPKLFNNITKEELINLTIASVQDGLSQKIEDVKITSATAPVVDGKETFVRFSFDSKMIVKIRNGSPYDEMKPIQSIHEQFNATYGASNVQWNVDTKEFTIKAPKTMMAVNIGNDTWTLIEINMDQPELMAAMFSPTIMDKLVKTN